ncbi:DUF4136 domain-containing protein [Hymenobacter koreensis]|uniref:DUF4136 domain-containing protein n=1 Tax=Hymenobacter koreensis TaxID=1084523 RepID=A0ABP8IUE7_9BACT
MKPISTSAVLLLGWALTSCFAARESRIESDYSYAGDFKHYRSYNFLESNTTPDTSQLAATVREAIQTHLRSQGYRITARRPDLLVSYRLFDGAMRFTGYDQPELTQWIKQETVESEETPETEKQGYKRVRYLLSDGTLLITLIDRKNGRAVWQGYASNVSAPAGPQAMAVMRRAVRSIFDRYRVLSEEYQSQEAQLR